MKFSPCGSRTFGLALVAGIFLFSIPFPALAQSSLLDANRALVSTGKPAAPPSVPKSRRLEADATATVDFGTSPVVTAYCRRGSFERVGLQRDQVVDITVQYSTASAGSFVTVTALDGGKTIAQTKNLAVDAKGAIHFKFIAGHTPGVYQIALRNRGQELGLQFWVRDEEHPGNNPRTINAGN